MAHICYRQYMSCEECEYYCDDPSGDYAEGKVCVAKDKETVDEYIEDYRKYLDYCKINGITPNRSNYLDSLIALKGGRT